MGTGISLCEDEIELMNGDHSCPTVAVNVLNALVLYP